MPKWTRYLDEDSEDEYKKVERIPQKPKRQDDKSGNKKERPNQSEK